LAKKVVKFWGDASLLVGYCTVTWKSICGFEPNLADAFCIAIFHRVFHILNNIHSHLKMPRSKELSSEVKGQIIGMSNSGKSARQIGRELDIAETTVGYVIRKFRMTGSSENKSRSGRPSVLTARDKSHLATTVKRNRFMPLREITDQLPANVYRWTVSKALKESGMSLCAAAKKPNISPKNIIERKNWCKDLSKWSDDDWQKVIWSDESTVELGLSSRKVKVWRTVGQRYNPECLAPNRRSGRISVMFWSCFWQDELPLVALEDGDVLLP
jgi:transposase